MGILKDHPELVLFLCLAAGYLLGKLRVGPLTLGGICGTLIVSLLIGAWTKVEISGDVKTIFFALFIFALGYMAGPQFFANLNRKSLRFFVLCGIEVVTVVAIALGLAKAFDLDVGTAAGILAGAATESAVVGTATESIGQLSGLTPEQISTYQGHVATAYTVCYLFGLITIVMYTSQIMPMLLRINLRDASRELWEKTRGTSGSLEADERESLPGLVGRTYLVTKADGSTVGALESGLENRITIESVKRGSTFLEPSPTWNSPSPTWSWSSAAAPTRSRRDARSAPRRPACPASTLRSPPARWRSPTRPSRTSPSTSCRRRTRSSTRTGCTSPTWSAVTSTSRPTARPSCTAATW